MANTIRPRAQGETEDEYKRYTKLTQGEQARSAATARGVDTSGQYWDGKQFKAMDAGPMKFIGEHPYVGMGLAIGGPLALAGIGGGLGAGAAATSHLGGQVALTSSALPAAGVSTGVAGATAGGVGAGSMGLLSSLTSPLGINTLAQLGGGILQGIGQGKQNDKQMALQREQLAMQQAQAVPTRQDWRQNQALLAAILPALSNAKVQAPAQYQQYVPQISGGFQLPQGGLGTQDVMSFFAPQARQNAEAELDNAGRSKLTPASSMNYAGTGYGQPGGYGIAQMRRPLSPLQQNSALQRVVNR